MKRVKPSKGVHQFPRWRVEAIQTRERDLVIRITDWSDLPQDCSKGEPGYDVEVYIGGVYDFNESESFPIMLGLLGNSMNLKAKKALLKFEKGQALTKAIIFAKEKIESIMMENPDGSPTTNNL